MSLGKIFFLLCFTPVKNTLFLLLFLDECDGDLTNHNAYLYTYSEQYKAHFELFTKAHLLLKDCDIHARQVCFFYCYHAYPSFLYANDAHGI